MTVLQIGYPKSGNYWLYTTLKHVLNEAGVEDRSFIRHQPIYALAKSWELSYPEQVDINMIDIFYQAVFYRISSRYRSIVKDVPAYVKSNRHVWTHSNFCERTHEVLPLFDKLIYIVRDPRDILLSEARFAFSPYMQEYWPTIYSSEEDYIHHEAFKIGRRWKNHVTPYLDHAEQYGIHIVFYENMLTHFEEELSRLTAYLGLELSEESKKAITERTDFKNMKQQSPDHVRKGSLFGWKENLAPEYVEAIDDEAFIILEKLGYPMKADSSNMPVLQ